MTDLNNPETIEIHGLRTITKLCHYGADNNMEGCTFTEIVERLFAELEKAKAQAVPEGYCLVPKEIPDSVVSCLENSGFHWGDGTRDHYTPIYSLMVEVASESGAEK
ncbi:hypothetical protein [Acinetobacter baumannii]|uniref:hypothetical protein n=1 Tax=Acinetobacter baumannii TaxID=470 RepID=UPI000DE74425|nr:hypothetical protein [Acinetobacter baumannii]SSU76385.1 Uncharacterised protein [Acinetobacter baumannii]